MAEPIYVTIPTTETLTLEALRARAREALLDFEEVEMRTFADAEDVRGEIHFEVLDEKAAEFWRARGALWGSPDYPTHIFTEEAPADADAG